MTLHLTPAQWLLIGWMAGLVLWLLAVLLLSRRTGRGTQWDDPTPGNPCRICGMTGGHWSGCAAIRRRGVTR